MNLARDLYPLLVGISGLLVVASVSLLLAPLLAPPPLEPTVRPLAELWLLWVVIAGIGGSLAALLFLRGLH